MRTRDVGVGRVTKEVPLAGQKRSSGK